MKRKKKLETLITMKDIKINPEKLVKELINFDKENQKVRFVLLGEEVKFHEGGTGTVISSNKELWSKMGQPIPEGVSCCVLWNDNKLRGNPFNSTKGINISISLPGYVFNDKYNPIIRPVNFYNPILDKTLKSFIMEDIYKNERNK